MSDGSDANCRVALATWMFLAHTRGQHASDAEIHAACEAVSAAAGPQDGDAAGQALIDRVSALVDRAGAEPDGLARLLHDLYGESARSDLGDGSRADRLHRIRAYQFQRGLPWLARIIERHPDGSVGPSWLLVERVTDQVRIMDPNPWDDIPEERTLPTTDFLVLWELDACTSFAIA